MKRIDIKYIRILFFIITAAIYFIFVIYQKSICTGRIDISTKLVDMSTPQLKMYVNGSKKSEKPEAWMQKHNQYGYTVQKNNKKVDIVLKSLTNSQIQIKLRGKYELDSNKKITPLWVDFTHLVINDENILKEPTPVWHDQPFVYTFDAKQGQEYKIRAEWAKHK